MRGKGQHQASAPAERGITPAYAGKRLQTDCLQVCCGDHPRLCGEKAVQRGDISGMSGSPPPMRGKASKQLKPFLKDRITPAYAGKSNNCILRGTCRGDHPRLCGEKCRQLDLWGTPEGSPPPMRGKARSSRIASRSAGITPAYAGKSNRLWIDCAFSRGSPPPMRGKEKCLVIRLTLLRITPAYAGKR